MRLDLLGDGSEIVQRDVYSAFLACCVVTKEKEHRHHPSYVEAMWVAQESVLRRADGALINLRVGVYKHSSRFALLVKLRQSGSSVIESLPLVMARML